MPPRTRKWNWQGVIIGLGCLLGSLWLTMSHAQEVQPKSPVIDEFTESCQKVEWHMPPDSPPVTGYRVYRRKLHATEWPPPIDIRGTEKTEHWCRDLELNHLGVWELAVSAYNRYGESKKSQSVFFMIKPAVVIQHAPPKDSSTFQITELQPERYTYIPRGLVSGERVYSDRQYRFTTIPERYQQWDFIQTMNADKRISSDAPFFSFVVSHRVSVIVFFDPRIHPVPSWLQSWQKQPETIATTNLVMDIYQKTFSPGLVQLFGPGGTAMTSMYGVALTVIFD